MTSPEKKPNSKKDKCAWVTIRQRLPRGMRTADDLTQDMTKEMGPIYTGSRRYTLVFLERIYALYKAVEYVTKAGIPGDLVECGVWCGGCVMVMAKTLLKMGEQKRKIYLYDTFAGMSKPTAEDRETAGQKPALPEWEAKKEKGYNRWDLSPLEDVKKNVLNTGYPKNNFVFVKGKVEDTLPATRPSQVALLRLDTDWYQSTYHELKHLFPLLSPGGVLIIDDYGHWAGARKAVDQYLAENKIKILLNRIDYTGRMGIKI